MKDRMKSTRRTKRDQGQEDRWLKNTATRKKQNVPIKPRRTDTEIQRLGAVFDSYILPTDSSRVSIPYTLGIRDKQQYEQILQERLKKEQKDKSKTKSNLSNRRIIGSNLIKKSAVNKPKIKRVQPGTTKPQTQVNLITDDEKAKIERDFAMARQQKLRQIEEELNVYVQETEERNKGLLFSQGLHDDSEDTKKGRRGRSSVRKVGPQTKAKLPAIRKQRVPTTRQKQTIEDPKQLLKKQLMEEEERKRQEKLREIQEELHIYSKGSEGTLPPQGIKNLKTKKTIEQKKDVAKPKKPRIEIHRKSDLRISMIDSSIEKRDKENELRNKEREEKIAKRKEQRLQKKELHSYIIPHDEENASPQMFRSKISPQLLSPFSPHPLSPNPALVSFLSNPMTPVSPLRHRPALPSIRVTGGDNRPTIELGAKNNRFRRLPVVLTTKENNQLYVPQQDFPGAKIPFFDENSTGLDLPAVGLDQDLVNLYLEAMDGEKEKIHNIRVIVLGNEGVGKTTLCRRLLGESIQGVKSTNSIDIKQRILVNLQTGERTFIENEKETETAIKRITDVVIAHKKKKETKGVVKKAPTAKRKPPPKPKPIEPIDNPNIKFVPKMVPPSAPRTPATPMRKIEDQIVTKKDKHYTLARYHQADVKAVLERMDEDDHMYNKAYLSMWDFAGEDVFFATHHVFLSNDAVYLVVFDIKQCMEDRKHLERIHFWLRSIITYSLEAKSKRTTATPPIILVGTHLDKVHVKSTEVDSIMRQMFRLPDIDTLDHHLNGVFAVDNSKVDPKIESIWGAILSSAPLQSQWGKELPAKWLSLERELMKLKERGKKILTVRQVSAIGRKCETPIGEMDQVDNFLQYLHLSGNVMYFGNQNNDKQLDSSMKVVLDPKWIVDAFRRFLTATKFSRPKRRDMRSMWARFHETGHLTSKLVKDAWTRRDSDRFMVYKRTLLTYMIRLGLISHPPYLQTSGRPFRVSYYIVPHMLQTVGPEKLMRTIRCPFLVHTKTLCLVFRNKFVPFPVLDKIFASFLSSFESYKEPKRCLGCFKLDVMWKMVLYCTESVVKICLFRFGKSGTVESGIGVNVRQFLETSVQRILDTHKHKQIQFDMCLHCDMDGDEPIKYVTVREIEQRRHAVCCPNKEGHVLTPEHLEPWYGAKTFGVPNLMTKLEMETSLSALQLDNVPTSKQTSQLCREIGPDYDLLFCELGLDYPVIHRTQELFRYHSINTVIMQLLEKWKKKFWNRATVRSLTNALLLHDMDLSFLDEIFMEDEFPPITSKRFY